LRSIARDLNTRHIPIASGGQWMIPTLKAVLTSGRISGRREYHGEIMHENSWPAIITPPVSDQLRALLTARTYLLSGILRCATCGKGLGGRPPDAGRRYVCAKAPGNGRCGTVTIMAGLAETEVRDQVLTALDDPAFLARLMTTVTTGTDAEHITSQLRRIDDQREELAAMWAARELTRKEWLAARAELDTLTATLASSEHGRAWPSSPLWKATCGTAGTNSPTEPAASWSPPSPTTSMSTPAATPAAAGTRPHPAHLASLTARRPGRGTSAHPGVAAHPPTHPPVPPVPAVPKPTQGRQPGPQTTNPWPIACRVRSSHQEKSIPLTQRTCRLRTESGRIRQDRRSEDVSQSPDQDRGCADDI
jgi:hypothetical protein